MSTPNNLDPSTWPKEQQVLLGIAIVVGAILGLVVGYTLSARHYYTFGRFLTDLERSASWFWLLSGAFIGAAIVYVRKLGPLR